MKISYILTEKRNFEKLSYVNFLTKYNLAWLWLSISYRPWNALLHQLYVSRTLLARYAVYDTTNFLHGTVRFLYYTILLNGAVHFSYDTKRYLYDMVRFLHDTIRFICALQSACSLSVFEFIPYNIINGRSYGSYEF